MGITYFKGDEFLLTISELLGKLLFESRPSRDG